MARVGAQRIGQEVLIGESEGKSSIGKIRRGWENNFKMDVK